MNQNYYLLLHFLYNRTFLQRVFSLDNKLPRWQNKYAILFPLILSSPPSFAGLNWMQYNLLEDFVLFLQKLNCWSNLICVFYNFPNVLSFYFEIQCKCQSKKYIIFMIVRKNMHRKRDLIPFVFIIYFHCIKLYCFFNWMIISTM